jgi:hypothetical protein
MIFSSKSLRKSGLYETVSMTVATCAPFPITPTPTTWLPINIDTKMTKRGCFEANTIIPLYESLPVSRFLSPEFLGLSSSSDHLSPSSPTAKIVSPSRDSRGRGDGFGGGFGDRPRPLVLLGTGVRSSGVLPSSSSRESASERISKPSSSCAN